MESPQPSAQPFPPPPIKIPKRKFVADEAAKKDSATKVGDFLNNIQWSITYAQRLNYARMLLWHLAENPVLLIVSANFRNVAIAKSVQLEREFGSGGFTSHDEDFLEALHAFKMMLGDLEEYLEELSEL